MRAAAGIVALVGLAAVSAAGAQTHISATASPAVQVDARPAAAPLSGAAALSPDGAAVQAAAPQPRRRPVRDTPRAVAATDPAFRIRLSVHAGGTSFTATDSFQAVLGTNTGIVLGGGGGVLIGRRLFVDVQVSRFSADGERVFVTDDLQRFPLGIPLTVTVVPIDISVGWRFAPGPPKPGAPTAGQAKPGATVTARRSRRPVPFVGGGLGILRYRETADFAQPGDDVDESHGSYHVLGGLELPLTRRIGAAVDGLYRWVPDAIGEGGVSKVYGDTDLGGFTIRARATFTF